MADERLEVIKQIAIRGNPESSKSGQDFLEWIVDICDGADPLLILDAMHEAYGEYDG